MSIFKAPVFTPTRARRLVETTLPLLVAFGLSGLALGCGGGRHTAQNAGSLALDPRSADGGVGDQSRCDFHRADREAQETAGPGSIQPNVRRVFQIIGTGDGQRRVLVCREIDSNLDGIKDIVRIYNEKGESLHEEADTNYDGRIDTWITFTAGRVSKEEMDTDFDGRPDVWKYYVDGKLTRIQRDMSHDGVPDQWEFYTDGKLERIGVDLDHDQHVDRWDHDEQARLAEEAEAAKTAEKAQDGGAPLSSSQSSAGAADAGAGARAGADAGAARSSKRPKKR